MTVMSAHVVGYSFPAFLSLPPPLTRDRLRTVSPKPHIAAISESLFMANKRVSSSVRPPPHAERPPASDGRPKNRLLAALPADDFNRLRMLLTTVPVRVKQVLQKNGEPIRAVYFLNGGVASITTALADGTMVEAATVGDEGMLGVEAFLSMDAVAPGETLIQVPDTSAERMSVEDFRWEIGRHGALHDLVGRYTQVVIAQMMQSTACNALHQ